MTVDRLAAARLRLALVHPARAAAGCQPAGVRRPGQPGYRGATVVSSSCDRSGSIVNRCLQLRRRRRRSPSVSGPGRRVAPGATSVAPPPVLRRSAPETPAAPRKPPSNAPRQLMDRRAWPVRDDQQQRALVRRGAAQSSVVPPTCRHGSAASDASALAADRR